jgi:hypothetical protein
MGLSSVRKDSPRDFLLRIFVRDDESTKLQLIAKLPNSKCVPRIGEKLIIPILDKFSKTVGSRKLIVKDVTYDIVDDGVYIGCEKISIEVTEKFKNSYSTPSVIDTWDEPEVKASRKTQGLVSSELPNLESQFAKLENSESELDNELESLKLQLENL